MGFKLDNFGTEVANAKGTLGGICYYRYRNSEDDDLTTPGYFPALLGLGVGDRIFVIPQDASNADELYVVTSIANRTVEVEKVSSGGGSAVIDELNVTPSTSAQTITPGEGVDGFAPVNVSAVDATIDANIVAENIKDGVEILGVTGNYTGASAAGILLFGEAVSDGTLTSSTGLTKSCVLSGVKKVTLGSLYALFRFGGNQYVFDTSGFTFSAPDLEEIETNGMARMFGNTAQAMTSFSMPKLKTLADSALEGTFKGSQYGTNLLTEADLSSVETIGPGGLSGTFQGQTALQKVYLTGVTSIHSYALGTSVSDYAFRYCDALTEIHFPAAMQATIEAMSGYADKWGATNATIYFD